VLADDPDAQFTKINGAWYVIDPENAEKCWYTSKEPSTYGPTNPDDQAAAIHNPLKDYIDNKLAPGVNNILQGKTGQTNFVEDNPQGTAIQTYDDTGRPMTLVQKADGTIVFSTEEYNKYLAQKKFDQKLSDNTLAKVSMEIGGKIAGETGVVKSIDGMTVVDGKVGGKIPVEDFKNIRNESIHNADADSITLGKYTTGSDSYIAKAGNDSTYFDLGNEWGNIQKKYNLTDDEMFNYFNKPALDDAVKNGKAIQFSHKPNLQEYKGSYLEQEWNYLKNEYGYSILIEGEGGIWYAK